MKSQVIAALLIFGKMHNCEWPKRSGVDICFILHLREDQITKIG